MHSSLSPLRRVALIVLALTGLLIGLWATLSPRGFYDSFPGGGRSWISIDGPYNEHLIRDVGGLNLSLVVLTISALIIGSRTIVRITGIVWLPFAVLHFVYHAAHASDLTGAADKVANVGGLGLTAMLALALAVSPGDGPR
jgi:hypothetical protein